MSKIFLGIIIVLAFIVKINVDEYYNITTNEQKYEYVETTQNENNIDKIQDIGTLSTTFDIQTTTNNNDRDQRKHNYLFSKNLKIQKHCDKQKKRILKTNIGLLQINSTRNIDYYVYYLERITI